MNIRSVLHKKQISGILFPQPKELLLRPYPWFMSSGGRHVSNLFLNGYEAVVGSS